MKPGTAGTKIKIDGRYVPVTEFTPEQLVEIRRQKIEKEKERTRQAAAASRLKQKRQRVTRESGWMTGAGRRVA